MKPIVYYSGEPDFHATSKGIYAVVFALNHPRLGQQVVKTSLVLSSDINGFETLNTMYKKNTWPFPSFPMPPQAPIKDTKPAPFNPDEFEDALI